MYGECTVWSLVVKGKKGETVFAKGATEVDFFHLTCERK